MKRIKYLGVVFAIPIMKNSYLAGVVVREKNNILLCYFFSRVYDTLPSQDIIKDIVTDNVLYVKQVSNMGLKDDTWIAIGKIYIDKEVWKIPFFFKKDILTKRFYKVEVNEHLEEIIKEEITLEESKNWYADGLAGSVFMERFLLNLLPTNNYSL